MYVCIGNVTLNSEFAMGGRNQPAAAAPQSTVPQTKTGVTATTELTSIRGTKPPQQPTLEASKEVSHLSDLLSLVLDWGVRADYEKFSSTFIPTFSS